MSSTADEDKIVTGGIKYHTRGAFVIYAWPLICVVSIFLGTLLQIIIYDTIWHKRNKLQQIL